MPETRADVPLDNKPMHEDLELRTYLFARKRPNSTVVGTDVWIVACGSDNNGKAFAAAIAAMYRCRRHELAIRPWASTSQRPKIGHIYAASLTPPWPETGDISSEGEGIEFVSARAVLLASHRCGDWTTYMDKHLFQKERHLEGQKLVAMDVLT